MRIISFLFVVLALAQDNSAVQISGIVVDAAGQPVANVTVKLEDAREPLQFGSGTRSDGRFVFSGLPPGRYIVRAEKAGFQQKDPSFPSSGIRYPGLAITVVRNQPVKDIRLQLTVADSIISGRILDENQPLRAVQVVLLEWIYDPSGSRVMSQIAGGTARTDENGEYRISGLGDGDYYLRVEPNATTSPFLRTYYPGGTDPAQAVPIKISGSGQIPGINLSVFRSKGYTIRMRLASATPIPPTLGFTVRGAPGTVHRAIGDETHLFEKVPPGSYNILMSCPQQSDCAISQPVRVDVVDKDVDLGTVALKPGVSITGRIVTNATLPERFAGTVVVDCPPNSFVRCKGVDVSTNGTFTFGTVREGPYHLWVQDLPAGLYIEAVRYGGKDVLGSGLVIDGVPQPLEVVISGPPGGIEGLVRNAKGEPVPGTEVVLVPSVDRRGNPYLYFLATTDQTGSFSIPNVTPGDYSVFAWETLPNYAYKNAGWLKDYEGQALRITVRGGLQTAADLRLIPSRR